MAILEEVIVDHITLTATDISNKYAALTRTPNSAAEVAMNAQGAPQIYGVDYSVTAKRLQWNGLILDGFLEAGDELRMVYSTEGSINVFDSTPQRDGVPVLSTINEEALIPLVESDSYFDSITKVARVDVTYVHSALRQVVTLVHQGPDLQTYVSWSTFARSGTWEKTRARLKDKDGAILVIGRSIIGDDQDLVLT